MACLFSDISGVFSKLTVAMRGMRSVMPQRANVAFYYRNSYLFLQI